MVRPTYSLEATLVSTYCVEVLSPASGVKVLLISERPNGFFLERFNARGELVGDTQHDEMDDAMRIAYSKYSPISDWHLCPDDVPPLDYIRARSESGT
jgi:hypothetical protein